MLARIDEEQVRRAAVRDDARQALPATDGEVPANGYADGRNGGIGSGAAHHRQSWSLAVMVFASRIAARQSKAAFVVAESSAVAL